MRRRTPSHGIGEASGKGRAARAATMAINDRKLGRKRLRTAVSVSVKVTSGRDFGVPELEIALGRVHDAVGPDAPIRWGHRFQYLLVGKARVEITAR